MRCRLKIETAINCFQLFGSNILAKFAKYNLKNHFVIFCPIWLKIGARGTYMRVKKNAFRFQTLRPTPSNVSIKKLDSKRFIFKDFLFFSDGITVEGAIYFI